jgi:hypothetical protein
MVVAADSWVWNFFYSLSFIMALSRPQFKIATRFPAQIWLFGRSKAAQGGLILGKTAIVKSGAQSSSAR